MMVTVASCPLLEASLWKLKPCLATATDGKASLYFFSKNEIKMKKEKEKRVQLMVMILVVCY